MYDDAADGWVFSRHGHPLPVELHQLSLDRVAAVVGSSDAHFAAKRWVFVKSIGGQRVGGLRCGGHVQRLAW